MRVAGESQRAPARAGVGFAGGSAVPPRREERSRTAGGRARLGAHVKMSVR